MNKTEPESLFEAQAMHSADRIGQWLETSGGIIYVVSDSVQFDDDLSHWQLGFQRLLEIDEPRARTLIETAVDVSINEMGALPSELSAQLRVNALKIAAGKLFALPAGACQLQNGLSGGKSFDGSPADTVFAASISGNWQRMVVGSRASEYAWQIEAENHTLVTASSIAYDRSYYECPKHAHCGMRDYIHHDDWRLEKARRLMRIVTGATRREPAKMPGQALSALDVGSATGYYRKAMDELGYAHCGIDLSKEAISICKETFGYETWHGSVMDLDRFADAGRQRFDLITLWDTIEHFDDPFQVVSIVKNYLSSQGVLVIRTPSLTALEADILKDMYYSFKLDHVRYFSPKSLTAMMNMHGLQELYLETTSHLFKGFLGADYLYKIGKELRGADILAVYGKQ